MKKLVSLAIFLLVAGIVIAVIGFSLIKFDSVSLSPIETYTNTVYVENSFTDIHVEGIDSVVTLIPWDGEECKLELTEAEGITHTVDISNGTLRVVKRDNRKWSMNIGFFEKDMTIDIYLPETVYEKLSVDTSSGKIVIPDGFSFTEIDAESSSGSIRIDGISATDIALKASSGSVSVNEVGIEGTFSVKTSSGSIKVDDVSAYGIELEASSGSISVKDIDSAKEITVETSSGSIKAEGVQCENADFSASSGSVKLYSVSCGSIRTETSSGSTSLSDVISAGNMNISAQSGSVKLSDCDAQDIEIRTGSGSVSGTLLSEKIFVTETGSGSVKVPQSFEGGRCFIRTGSGSIKISISGN